MTLKTNRRAVLGGLAATVAAPAILTSTRAYAANPKLRVGFVTPTTGPLAGFAEADDYIIEGLRAKFAGGVMNNGKSYDIEIIKKDSQSNPNRAAEVAAVLDAADTARRETGGHLAGFIAYEAGLALEPRLVPLADARTGASGPLVWLGLFESERTLAAAEVDAWLSENAEGEGWVGPLDPQLSPGGYRAVFDRLQDAIRDGDIYQANLTYPLSGSYRGDPVALYAQLRASAKAGYGGLIFDGSHWLLSLSPVRRLQRIVASRWWRGLRVPLALLVWFWDRRRILPPRRRAGIWIWRESPRFRPIRPARLSAGPDRPGR